ncbi:MAG: tetratricopeptide repeat protein [Candidatus Methylomirabilales bacterium]
MTPWTRLAVLGLLVGALTACAGAEADRAQQQSARSHYDIGLGALAENNLPKAISELQIAAKEGPQNPRNHYALGNAYLRNRQFDEAIASLRQAVEMNPRLSDAYSDLGAAYVQKQQWDLAIDAFRKALANPQYANPERAYLNLGIIYYVRGQHDRAAEEFSKLLDLFPQSADGHFFLGRTLLAQNKLAEAREQLGQAIKLEAGVPIYHLELGVALLRSGQRDAARQSFRRALDLNPLGPEAEQARQYLRQLN